MCAANSSTPPSTKFSFMNSSSAAAIDHNEVTNTPPLLRRSLTVDEEYARALRTKSYVDIWDKAHKQLRRCNSFSTITVAAKNTLSGDEDGDEAAGLMASHNLRRHYSSLTDVLLEPVRKSSLDSAAAIKVLLDYFNATAEASRACSDLLASIDTARLHHRALRLLLLSLSRSPAAATFADLSALLALDNPLSLRNLLPFRTAHALFSLLLRRLTVVRRRIKWRIRFVRLSKRFSVQALAAICGTAVLAALAVATHAVALVGAVPLVLAGPRVSMFGWLKKKARGLSKMWLEKAAASVDAAARGAYIVARDMDTVSRMVQRAEGEVEHGREVGRMVARTCSSCEKDMMQQVFLVREVVKEVNDDERGFTERLGELEQHVYLCLLTINRSRRLVAEQIGGTEAPPSSHGDSVIPL